ncbi:MAG: DNA methyltransferase [Parcubacteria group bacterium Gr01-1014_31]|nr:MAG: DNA methyltransferase [Parcubacteria group bacterium Gr01-1014_31]
MLNWNEIRAQAVAFAREWAGQTSEVGEYQSFWNEFFEVYGIRRRTVARYQEKVNLIGERHRGFIDLFWPGTLIVEHKSGGKNLDSAYQQAGSYFDALPEVDRPRYIVVTDYARIRFYDLEADGGVFQEEFELKEFPKKIKLFSFIPGFRVRTYREENPISVKAVQAIGKLYEAIRITNYPREAIDKLLTRLVFCFFADDTGIFNSDFFRNYLEERTKEDGSDIGAHLSLIFQILNTPPAQRQTNFDEDLASLEYVNGGLFAAPLPALFGTRGIRDAIIAAVQFDWSVISPAIFGSMFQSVMDDRARHDLGAHYTSEKNILKVLSGLFLDDLERELRTVGNNTTKLNTLWEKLAKITLLDPACGCGNFLVIAYRELRRIELEIIKRLHKDRTARVDAGQGVLLMEIDLSKLSKLSVERMFGIELESFPSQIAQLSLWLTDHMTNVQLGDYFGEPLRKLPLIEQPHIMQGNALKIDWRLLVSEEKLTYIVGNPPFIGSKVMADEQRAEIVSLFGDKSGGGVLDYVSGWYLKAAQYIQGTAISCAFVSTNSITQGEQVGILWHEMMGRYRVHINFAHRTFKWTNEAPGKAAVYCVVIGFGCQPGETLKIYEYEDIRGEPHEIIASHINPYLVDAPDVFLERRRAPLGIIPEIGIGNKPIDGGMYLFSAAEKLKFLHLEPRAEKFFKRWIGSEEFLNGIERWCLWVGDARPDEIRSLPEVMRRINAVRQYRALSKSEPTRRLAEKPTHFHVENIPDGDYLVIPKVSSERRQYIPIGFMGKDTLAGDAVFIVSGAGLYHFGVLESRMHMAWMRTVAGRLKSDYRYSKDIVYNSFPWPENPLMDKKEAVENAAQAVLDARAKFTSSTLADLYDPNTMPKELLDAHHNLDRAVDACYGKRDFKTEPERLEFLFGLYKAYLGKEEHPGSKSKPTKRPSPRRTIS